MLIIQAQAMGMCFGVEDALQLAHSQPNPQDITILGEIVHNQQVQDGLLHKGYHWQSEQDRQRLPNSPAVLITAHGISQAMRQRLTDKTVIDTTCPLVQRVHQQAQRWHQRGYRLILVGKPGHVEVLGITEDYPDTLVVPDPTALPSQLPGSGPWAVLAQTTTPPTLFQAVVQQLPQNYPEQIFQVVDTICKPTRQRQQAIQELLERVEALVVVGGANSNNTLRLLEQAQAQGKPAWRVEKPRELQEHWFRGLRLLGLSAGTSTPATAVQAVYRQLLRFAQARVHSVSA